MHGRQLTSAVAFPRAARSGIMKKIGRRYGLWLFVVIFLLPTSLAVVYYGFVATDRYVSEAQFIVRGVNSQKIGGLSVLLRTFGIDRSNDDSFAVHDYIQSRDAVADLSKTVDLRSIFAIPSADYLSRFGTLFTGKTQEALFRFYLRRVKLIESVETGITTVRVSTHRADDSWAIAKAVLALSEARVNAINERARMDTLASAEDNLRRAGEAVVAAQVELTRFRNKELLISPEKSAAGNLDVISTLSQDLAQEQVRLQQMQISSPTNPNIAASRERVDSLIRQIGIEKSKLTGSDDAIANKLGEFEGLKLQQKLSEKSYETATHSLEEARQEAARKQIYLEAVVQPHVPDESRDPLRFRLILTIAVLSLVTFVMCYLLVAGSREHLNLDE